MANAYKSVLASGGGVVPTGNAQPADVLAGKTFSNAEGIDKTGTMVNNGAVSGVATPTTPYVVPEGYHNGSGEVTASGTSVVFIGATNMNMTTYTVNVASLLPNYAELTSDNFFYNITSVYSRGTATDPSLTKTYNASTGDLSIVVGVAASGTDYRATAGNVYYISTALPTS